MALNKIVWALNVLDQFEVNQRALFLVGALSRETNAEVLPAFVLSPPRSRRSSEREILTDAFRALAEKRIEKYCEESDIEGLCTGAVLDCASTSASTQAETLLAYAAQKDASAVVVATHARSGLPRIFLGSFAESLIMRAKLPIFTVNPQTQVREKISRILMPTTLDSEYLGVYDKVLRMAKKYNADVILFFKEPLIPSPFMTPEIYQYIELEAEERKRDARDWVKRAQASGVRVEVILDPVPGYIPSAICTLAAERNVDLIAMASEAGSLTQIITGNFSRQVIREAPCPVWVTRETAKS